MAKSNLTIQERVGTQQTLNDLIMQKASRSVRVAMPGIVKSFNIDEQTVEVQPAIMERIIDETGLIQELPLPLLLDVPLVFPRSGGFSLTMPVNEGDECLIMFADTCIDAWWASGGVQIQEDIRRHDLSDAFAILGTWSQPNKVKNYSSTKAKLVHETSGNGAEVSAEGVNLVGVTKINGQALSDYIISFIPS